MSKIAEYDFTLLSNEQKSIIGSPVEVLDEATIAKRNRLFQILKLNKMNAYSSTILRLCCKFLGFDEVKKITSTYAEEIEKKKVYEERVNNITMMLHETLDEHKFKELLNELNNLNYHIDSINERNNIHKKNIRLDNETENAVI